MCYSGLCDFEDHMGDCTVCWKFDRLFNVEAAKRIHYTVCVLGGMVFYPEEEEWIEECSHNLVYQYAQKVLSERIKSPKGKDWMEKI